LRCVEVIAGVLGRAGEAGQKKRLEAAKTGSVTWTPPDMLGTPNVEQEQTMTAAEIAKRKREEKKAKQQKPEESESNDEGYW
jgi:small subunit ribosomal protein S2